MIKQQLRKVARKMAAWPIVGRFVRIGVAIIRLPEFRAAYLDSNHRQHVFETEQLPTLLQTLSDLNHRQLASDNERENFVRSVPIALRNVTREQIETRGQLESVSNFVGYLLWRVEFVRRELMFEMRYGASSPSSDNDPIKAKTEILNPEKLAAARSERLRLNLGCCHIAIEGYLNVDRRALPGVDIVAEVDDLPFEPGEVDEIFSAHLLENFPQEQLRRELLPYWIGLLKHGGILRSVVPDVESMIKRYASGSYSYASLCEVTFGAQDYDSDFHYNMFVAEQIEELLKEAGLVDIEWLERGRKNGACFEMEFMVVKK